VFEGCFGQRLQLVLLFGKEDGIGFSLRRAVDLLPDLFPAPGERPFIGFTDIGEGPAGEELLLDDRHDPFHLSLLLGISFFRRIGDKTVVAFQVGIGVVDEGS
jgi:hypothetical protein